MSAFIITIVNTTIKIELNVKSAINFKNYIKFILIARLLSQPKFFILLRKSLSVVKWFWEYGYHNWRFSKMKMVLSSTWGKKKTKSLETSYSRDIHFLWLYCLNTFHYLGLAHIYMEGSAANQCQSMNIKDYFNLISSNYWLKIIDFCCPSTVTV